MRLRSIAFRGLVRFTGAQPVSIDLDQLGPGLVAITGENGEGKTTVIEAPCAALYKALPSRGGWYESFHGRDAFVEAVFEDRGHEFKVRVQVDAEKRGTERYLFIDGESTTTGRAKEADAEVLRRFGSYELFLASVLGSQKRNGNFLDAAKGERKARFIELLNLAHLERMASDAKERRAAAEPRLADARDEVRVAQEQAIALEAAKVEAAAGQATADEAAHTLEAIRTEEASALSALERARGAQDRLAILEAAARTAERALGDGRAALSDAVQEEPQALRRAAGTRAGLDQQERHAAELVERAGDRHLAALRSIDTRREQLEAALHERPALEAAAKEAEELAAEKERLEAADRACLKAQANLQVAQGGHAGAARRVSDAEERVRDERERLSKEAALLDQVPCTAAPRWIPIEASGSPAPVAGDLVDVAGGCSLLEAAREARARGPQLVVAGELILALANAETAEQAAEKAVKTALAATDASRLSEIRRELPELQRQAGRLPAVDKARQDLEALVADLERANAARSKDLKDADAIREQVAAGRTKADEDLAAAVKVARERVAAAQDRLDKAAADAESAKTALATAREELGALTIPAAEASLSTAQEARYAAERTLRAADQELATINARLDILRAGAERLPELESAVRAAEVELGDWSLLAQACGRDGIQALEIAAAGPEVARLTNELMAVCLDARWAIAFETLREKKSERGAFSETFDIRCFDRGQERAVEDISGGERVVIGEGLALAIAIYMARKSGVKWEVLFRDETAGALSLRNAVAYGDLLRRAMALGGFRNIIFISHVPELTDRADVRLLVAGGRVAVEGAPSPARAEAVVVGR